MVVRQWWFVIKPTSQKLHASCSCQCHLTTPVSTFADLILLTQENPPDGGGAQVGQTLRIDSSVSDSSHSGANDSIVTEMFPSSKDHGIPTDATCRITVHDFVAVGGASTSRTVLQLEQGRDLALACSSSDRWVTPRLAIDSSAFSTYHLRRPSSAR